VTKSVTDSASPPQAESVTTTLKGTPRPLSGRLVPSFGSFPNLLASRGRSHAARLTAAFPPPSPAVVPIGPSPLPSKPSALPGGGDGILDGSSSTCNDPPCTWKWVVTCSGRQPVVKEGLTVTVSSGSPDPLAPPDTPAPFDIDLTGLKGPLECSAALSGTGEAPRPAA
jgi:hypothetical protein